MRHVLCYILRIANVISCTNPAKMKPNVILNLLPNMCHSLHLNSQVDHQK